MAEEREEVAADAEAEELPRLTFWHVLRVSRRVASVALLSLLLMLMSGLAWLDTDSGNRFAARQIAAWAPSTNPWTRGLFFGIDRATSTDGKTTPYESV